MPNRLYAFPRNVCSFLENGLLNAVDQPQRIHHELECTLFGIHRDRGYGPRIVLI